MEVQYERMVAEFVGLTPGDHDAHGMFSRLVDASHTEMSGLGLGVHSFLMCPYDAGNTACRLEAFQPPLSRDLIISWDRFAALYPTLVIRNPRLELRDLMQEMSERRESMSWPAEQEWAIERWVAEGAPEEQAPYVIHADIRARLLELHRQLGGWLYLDHDRRMVVFAETDEFRQVKVRLDAERERRILEERLRLQDAEQQRIAATQTGPRRWRLTSIHALPRDRKP